MKNIRDILFYVCTIGGFSVLMYFIVQYGEMQEAGKVTGILTDGSVSTWQQFTDTFHHNLTHPLAILLLQIITIIIAARAFGFLFGKIGQPTVIGEIIAGIFLGPSLVGTYFPEFSAFLFPKASLGNLQFLSQIGLILFMFIIGMELDLKELKKKAQDAVIVSHASIIIPFSLGVGLAYFLYRDYAPANVKFIAFSLFLGIGMSITAFPVLARIVQERGLSKTRLGTLVITCAAADDITAWCLLAAVIAIVKAGSVVSSFYTILMAVGYVLIMWKVVQPFLKRTGDIYSSKEGLSRPIVAIFFIMLLVSSFATEVIGIHALFGAFMAGIIMPSNMNFRSVFIEKVEDVSLVLLLPLFFVFTGLRTQIGLLNDPVLWELTGVIILVAVTGKFAGSALTARFVGQSWRDSLMIGALMNTRGLMELVVLNIGYDLGVLTPEVFTMMVIMALVTTFMTGPALDLINRFLPEKKLAIAKEMKGIYRILISFGSPQRGKSMLRLAYSFIKKAPENASITALHLTPGNELNQFNTKEYERESFKPIKLESQKLRIPVTTIFKPAQDIDSEITETANSGDYDLLMIGIGSSVFEGTLLGRILGFTTKMINPDRLYDTITGKEKLFENTIFDERVRQVIRSVKVPLGILIDKDFSKAEHIFIPLFSTDDTFLLPYAQKLMENNTARVTAYVAEGQNPELTQTVKAVEQNFLNNFSLMQEKEFGKEFLESRDLMLISLDSWEEAVEKHSQWLSYTPSVLIMRR